MSASPFRRGGLWVTASWRPFAGASVTTYGRMLPRTKAPTRQSHVMAPRSHGFYSLAAQSLRRISLWLDHFIAIAYASGSACGPLRASAAGTFEREIKEF